MNANELADELDDCGKFFEDRLYTKAATMLRQQQAEIEALKETLKEVVKISDRKHDTWDRAKELLKNG